MANKARPFKFTSPNLSSTERYREIVISSTTDVWQHLISRTEVIPDDCDWDSISDAQKTIILDTVSVEREWILDNDEWKAATMFDFDDDGSDD